jgi:putative Holliday junction resolvase
LSVAVRSGVRLGVDVGSVRVGVAASDLTGTLASPVTVLDRRRDGSELEQIAAIATERGVIEIVVGMPQTLRGRSGAAADAARAYAGAIARRVGPVPVRLVDERLSTVSAQRGLHEAGETTKSSRSRIDAAAAAVILQSALDGERAGGVPVGELVSGS